MILLCLSEPYCLHPTPYHLHPFFCKGYLPERTLQCQILNLITAFERISTGTTEMMLVAGLSG